MLRGETAALTAAFLWALSTVLFGRLGKSLSPHVLNWVKGLVAIALIALTLWLRGTVQLNLAPTDLYWLLLSGAVGIGLGDTAYFNAINLLGPRRALLMESLAPPLSALLALVFLQEYLSAIAWIGIAVTLSGVAWVISERVPASPGVSPRLGPGILWGGFAALAQASGAVISRGVLADTAIDPLWSGLLRIAAGVGVLFVLVGVRGRWVAELRPLKSRQVAALIVIAALLGTYLGIWLQQVSFKYSPAGIAQALLATSPLFVLPIAALVGDRVTWRALVGVLVAVFGIWLLISSQG